MKKYFITYGTNKYYHSKFRLEKEVNSLNVFDNVTLYDNKKLTNEFKEKYKDILDKEHGGGFWIWKLDIIKQELDKMKENEVINE